MKIWIVSSPPFINDFEKLSSHWPEEIETVLTPVENFSVGISGVRNFLSLENDLKPDIILTDHGHPAFGVLHLKNILNLYKTPIYLFLRGNYWLESKTYKANASRKIVYSLSIETDKNSDAALIGPDGHKYKYVTSSRKGNRKQYEFGNVYPANYVLTISTGGNVTSHNLDIPVNTTLADGTKIVTTTSFAKSTKLSRLKEGLRLKLFKFGWLQLISTAKVIIPVCEYLEKEARRNTKTKTVVCPIGIDPYVDKPKELKLKHPAVVMVQNHQIAEKSKVLVDFADVIKELSNITFYISKGKVENRSNENYLKVFDTLSPLDNVNFVDIDSSNREDYLSSADLYVLRSGLDCTPATVIEASMVGKPVIASKVGGVPEMIINDETGWTIENSDKQEWLNKIELLTTDKKLAEKMGNSAKNRALNTYATPVIAQRLLKIISNQ